MPFVERVRKERVRKERVRKRERARREMSDYTPLREKIHKNNFRVSLPRRRAVRSWG